MIKISEPTQKELEQGYQICPCGDGVCLLQAGFDVDLTQCPQCMREVADADEFFNVPASETPKILNKHKDKVTEGSVYIGRPGKWGNPFTIGKDGTREEVVAKYRKWLSGNIELMRAAESELKGRDLVCFCAPLPCHGDILLQVANSYVPIELMSK